MTATSSSAVAAEELNQPPSENQLRVVLRRFTRHRMAMISLVVLLTIFIAALLAPYIAPYGRDELNLGGRFLPPLSTNPATEQFHMLGTDHLGRDYLTRLLYAGRVSLLTAIMVSTVATVIGMSLGLLAGYFGRWVDVIISRLIEFVSTFPLLPILLILTAILLQNPDFIPLPGFITSLIVLLTSVQVREAQQVTLVITVLALLIWITDARLMRGMVLAVREQPYIESSRALGGSNLRIIARHVFPNAFPPLIVSYTLGINGALVLESALSFLGFGIQEPTPTWGNMLSFAQSNMFNHPWMPLIPGLPLLICSLAINYIGDGLRDALDPRMKL